jgi:hypothetical protein
MTDHTWAVLIGVGAATAFVLGDALGWNELGIFATVTVLVLFASRWRKRSAR